MKVSLLIISIIFKAISIAQKTTLTSGVFTWNDIPKQTTEIGERKLLMDGQTLDLSNLRIHPSTLLPGKTNHPSVAYDDREEIINQSAQNMEVFKKDSGNIIADGASLKMISNQFKFTEGPAIDKKGNVFFTDQPNDKIWKYDTEGKLSVFMDKTGRSNGLYFDKKGNLLACADEKNEIWSISPKKKIKVLFTDYQGRKLNGPNDLWADSKGGIYFTDPYYQRPYWTRKEPEIVEERVYYLPKGQRAAVVVDESLKKPNGIVGTPDGKYLYVADIGDNKTYRFTINENGTLSDRRLFVELGSDGLTLDNQGNLYLTGNGVTVYNKEGMKIEHIPVPSKWTANVSFYGKERNILFITASDSVYSLEMKVKGVE